MLIPPGSYIIVLTSFFFNLRFVWLNAEIGWHKQQIGLSDPYLLWHSDKIPFISTAFCRIAKCTCIICQAKQFLFDASAACKKILSTLQLKYLVKEDKSATKWPSFWCCSNSNAVIYPASTPETFPTQVFDCCSVWGVWRSPNHPVMSKKLETSWNQWEP